MTTAVKQVVTQPSISAAKGAKAVGNVAESQSCTLMATNGVTGQPFVRAFGSYSALEQWMATQAEAANLDLTNIRIVGSTSF